MHCAGQGDQRIAECKLNYMNNKPRLWDLELLTVGRSILFLSQRLLNIACTVSFLSLMMRLLLGFLFLFVLTGAFHHDLDARSEAFCPLNQRLLTHRLWIQAATKYRLYLTPQSTTCAMACRATTSRAWISSPFVDSQLSAQGFG